MVQISNKDTTSNVIITPKGWEYIEKHREVNRSVDQVFVAMSFSKEMESLWQNAIEPAVREAGYKPYRVDKEPHIDRIDAKIVAEIKESRFLVADVTEQKQGVYFEAGYALGLGLPVIWSVREDGLKKVHFDTRQYNHIVWNDEAEFRQKLFDVIRALIGRR